MPECEVCGNDYDKAMEITKEGSTSELRDRAGA